MSTAADSSTGEAMAKLDANPAFQELMATDFTNYLNGPLANITDESGKRRAGRSSLVMIYASWCGHCQHYLQSDVPQKTKEVVEGSGRSDLGLFKFEGSTLTDAHKVSSEFFKVTGYPTFILIYVGPEPKAQMKFDYVPDSVNRDDPSAQFKALYDFDARWRNHEPSSSTPAIPSSASRSE